MAKNYEVRRIPTANSLHSLRPHFSSSRQEPSAEIQVAMDGMRIADQGHHKRMSSDNMTDTLMEDEDVDVPIVLIHDIPKITYHEKPLHFMSEPGISQKQYKHMVLSGA